MTEDITIGAKTDKPSVEKKVYEERYSDDGGYGTGYNDVADYNIGDAVPFHLIGSVPDMTYYDTYSYIFTDTLSDGFSAPDASDVKVYYSDDAKGTNKDEITVDGKNVAVGVNGQNITVTFANLKTTLTGLTGVKYIIVEYSAVLDSDAEIGLNGNTNTVKLTYSNNPDDSSTTGETTEDEVVVFTYELDTTKVDGANTDTKLADAEFVLYKKVTENGTEVEKYAVVDSAGKITGWGSSTTDPSTGAVTYPTDSTLTSAQGTGLFSVVGLDSGTYYLKEIKAPDGYNLLTADIEVIITAYTDNGQNWDGTTNALTGLSVTADNKDGTGDASTGVASITVANNQGSQLPETGGIGTTIFYVVGGILVVGSVLLLVVKKRMSAYKD